MKITLALTDTKSKEIDQEIIDEWFNNFAKDKPAIKSQGRKSEKLRRKFYTLHHKPDCVNDLIPDELAQMQVLVMEEVERRPVTICDGCKAKTCKDTCGQEDYRDVNPKAYKVADTNSDVITASIPPFSVDKIKPLEVGKLYDMKCSANEFNGNMSLNIIEVSEIEVTPYDDLVADLREHFEILDKIPDDKFDKMVSQYAKEDIDKAISELKIVKSDGVYVIGQ